MDKSDLDLSPKEAREVAYKSSILMLERLNILIAILENPKTNPDAEFLNETVEKCWELASQLCALGAGIDDNEEMSEQWSAMAEFLGGP